MEPDAEDEALAEARDDFKTLLDRGYRRDSALSFVCDHHRLDAPARNRLLREVYSEPEIADTESKLINPGMLAGRELVVDGFNVLITVEAGLSGGEVFLSMDGMVRDNAMAFSNYKIRSETEDAAARVVGELARNPPSVTTWVFDSQIGNSGRLAEHVRRLMDAQGVRGRCMTSPDADGSILKFNSTTATSDTMLIRRLESVVDLPQAVFAGLAGSLE